VVALIKVAAGDAGPESVDPSVAWLNPFAVDSFDALVAGVLIAVFMLLWRSGHPGFFKRRPQTADPALLDERAQAPG
jgi:hypothetical protein